MPKEIEIIKKYIDVEDINGLLRYMERIQDVFIPFEDVSKFHEMLTRNIDLESCININGTGGELLSRIFRQLLVYIWRLLAKKK